MKEKLGCRSVLEEKARLFQYWIPFRGYASDIVLVWRNFPCIVIGRHQNPWSEVNLLDAAARGVAVARRRSGGGTVYHDLENLNVTFFTTRKAYDRRGRLLFIMAQSSDCFRQSVMRRVSARGEMA